jgi:hypothetical protein
MTQEIENLYKVNARNEKNVISISRNRSCQPMSFQPHASSKWDIS